MHARRMHAACTPRMHPASRHATYTLCLAQVLTRGIAQAVSVTGAWVITGGVDAGVSRLLGTGLRKWGCLSPVIGVTPWGILPALRRVETRRDTRPNTHALRVCCSRLPGASDPGIDSRAAHSPPLPPSTLTAPHSLIHLDPQPLDL